MVGRPPKPASPPKEIIRQVLIDNVRQRWYAAFPAAETEKDRLTALAKRSGVGKETLRKILRGEQSPTLDTVDSIAQALGTTCSDLLRVPRQEAVA